MIKHPAIGIDSENNASIELCGTLGHLSPSGGGHPAAVAIGIDGGEVGFALRAEPSHSGDKGDGGVNTSMVVEIPEVCSAVTSKWAKSSGGPSGGPSGDECQNLIATDTCPTLRSGGNKTGGDRPPGTDVDTADSLIAFPSTLSGTQRVGTKDLSTNIGAANPPAIAFQERGRNGGPNLESQEDLAYSLNAPNGGGRHQEMNVQTPTMAVRRLTPRECERLQGFPDDFTLVKFNGKPACDGPRYKAIGNSMAVPNIEWIGRRMDLVDELVPWNA